MLRMGNVYFQEGDQEKAYVLYHKYLTLFVERIREHPEYRTCPSVDKARVRNHSRSVMEKSEALKLSLRSRYAEEHDGWLQLERERKQREEEECHRRREEEGRKVREEVAKYHEAKEKNLAMQRDYETALFHQMQLDKEYEQVWRGGENFHTDC